MTPVTGIWLLSTAALLIAGVDVSPIQGISFSDELVSARERCLFVLSLSVVPES